jgi:DNA repair exonuclease SbcCD ATPase subunit
MNMGANMEPSGAEAQQQGDGSEWAAQGAWEAPAEADDFRIEEIEATPERRPAGGRILAALLILLGLAWIGAAGYSLSLAWPGPDLPAWIGWAGTASTPLVLLGLVWLILGRTSRRETAKFTDAVAAMRHESQALEGVLASVTARLAENRASLSEEATRLMSLGEEASDRLGRVTHLMARETAELDRKAQALDNAAASARVDIGVLMSDLPRAEEQARAAAEAMKQAGLAAHGQAGALESQLAALAARGREADEVAGGSAQRLGAHIARIESGAGAAAERMNEAAAQMESAVDGAMAKASESVDQARAGLEAQGQAMLAMIEQSRAAFEEAGAEATKGLAERLDLAGRKVEMLAGRLASQDAASRTLLAGIARQLDEIGAQIAHIGDSGDVQNARLTQSLGALRETASTLHREVDQGQAQAEALTARTHELGSALALVTGQLRDEMPPAMAGIEIQSERTAASAEAVVAKMAAMEAAAKGAAAMVAESEAGIARQREALDALLALLRDGAGAAQESLQALGAAAGEAQGTAARLATETGPELIDALVRVRDAAGQAASHAREAIAAVIPESVAALVEASRSALGEAMSEPVQAQLAEIGNASHMALATAKAASERLTRQLLTIGEAAAAIEERIGEDRAEREEKAAAELSQRVTLIIDALNSTAIDVTKILSNEASDAAWAAYLKGDRGVFTRRAVRLLESGEAREILRHYEEEPDFRGQVNRYIADFEAMLRRVLADRDGSALSITLLSSDMGKLYVALAQAIERIRR